MNTWMVLGVIGIFAGMGFSGILLPLFILKNKLFPPIHPVGWNRDALFDCGYYQAYFGWLVLIGFPILYCFFPLLTAYLFPAYVVLSIISYAFLWCYIL